MSAEANTAAPYGGWAALLAAWQELEVPAGWRAEVMGEQGLTLTPPPGNGHNVIVELVHRTLARTVPDDWGLYQTLGVSIPMRLKLFVPDLVVIPRAVVAAGPDSEPVPAEHALLVVEVTSRGNAESDRKQKRWGYAHAAVPQYLLIDRFDDDGPSITLFTEPVDGHYEQIHRLPFGREVRLPEPFEVDLDTSRF
ncbi:MAG TPA: Uma2 family endonuclease [Pseudonocardiaceae bacterium]|jgi:Uma2 family endonuclease|nr:Uma2 family endonuclease [Pseudonocardiaceae bacterium]